MSRKHVLQRMAFTMRMCAENRTAGVAEHEKAECVIANYRGRVVGAKSVWRWRFV
jgi:hypothetical protein